MPINIRVDHHFHPTPSDGLESLRALIIKTAGDLITMGEQTNQAVAELVAEVADSKGKLASLETTVRGFPAVVGAAVADALAAANVDDAIAAEAIRSATAEISTAVDQALDASDENPDDGEDNQPAS